MDEPTELIQTLLHEASLRKSLAEQRVFLVRSGASQEVRTLVEKLLRALRCGDDFLERELLPPAAPVESDQAESGAAPRMDAEVGAYRLLRRLGEGSMGIVYAAEQLEPLCRQVAIKLIRPGIATGEMIERFHLERRSLARMEHPNIAQIIDGGATQDGWPYFVMELVDGGSITDFCDAEELTVEQRLQLFLQVCAAVRHAHQRGVIHRDLKPSNVLIARIDGVATPKVIDFGVAKLVEMSHQDEGSSFGTLIGEPRYISPEQADFARQTVDTRCDVFALGVLLFELLTGDTPLSVDTCRGRNSQELRALVEHFAPTPPSRRFDKFTLAARHVAAVRRSTVDGLHRRLSGDLDCIVGMALEPDRERRYQSADELAADIRRYLLNEPVHARPQSSWYHLQKFVRRHRWPVVLAATMCAASLAVVAAGTLLLVRTTRDQRELTAAASRARTAELIAEAGRQETEAARRDAEQARLAAEQEAARAARQLGLTLESVQTSVLLLCEGDRVHDPQWQPIRDRLLALLTQQFRLPPNEHDEHLRETVVNSFVELSRRCLTLGRFDEALKLAENAEALARVRVEEDVASPRPAIRLGRVLVDKAYALSKLGRWRETVATLDEALGIWPYWEGAASLEIEANWAATLAQRAEAQIQLGQIEQACADCDQARQLYAFVLQAAPDNVFYRTQFAALLRNSAVLMDQLGRYLDYRADLLAATAILEHEAALAPHNLVICSDLALCYVQLMGVCRKANDAAGAVEVGRRAVQILREVAARSPDNLEAVSRLAFVERATGDAVLQTGDTAAALAHFQAAADRFQFIYDEEPNDSSALDVAATINWIGRVARQRGDHQAAARCHQAACDLLNQYRHPQESASVWQELAESYRLLAETCVAQSDLSGAVAAQDQVVEILGRIRLLGPHTSANQHLAKQLNWAGRYAAQAGELDAALAYHDQALAVLNADPRNDQDLFCHVERIEAHRLSAQAYAGRRLWWPAAEQCLAQLTAVRDAAEQFPSRITLQHGRQAAAVGPAYLLLWWQQIQETSGLAW